MNSYGYSYHQRYLPQHSHDDGYHDIGYHDQIPVQATSHRPRHHRHSCPIMHPRPISPPSGNHILGPNYDPTTVNDNNELSQCDNVPRYQTHTTAMNNTGTAVATAFASASAQEQQHNPSNTSDYHSACSEPTDEINACVAAEFANWDGEASFEAEQNNMRRCGPRRYPVDMYLFNRMLQHDKYEHAHDDLEVLSNVVDRHPTPGPQVLRSHAAMYAQDNIPVDGRRPFIPPLDGNGQYTDHEEGVIEHSPPKRRHSTKMVVVDTLKRVLSVVKRDKEGSPAKNTMTLKKDAQQQQQQQQGCNNEGTGDSGGAKEVEKKKIGRSRTWNIGDKVSVIQTESGMTPMAVNHVKKCLWCQGRTIDGGKLGGGM